LAKAKVSSFWNVTEASQRLGGVGAGAAAAGLDAGGVTGRLCLGAGVGSVFVAEGSGEDAHAARNTAAAPNTKDSFFTGVLAWKSGCAAEPARDFLAEIIHQS